MNSISITSSMRLYQLIGFLIFITLLGDSILATPEVDLDNADVDSMAATRKGKIINLKDPLPSSITSKRKKVTKEHLRKQRRYHKRKQPRNDEDINNDHKYAISAMETSSAVPQVLMASDSSLSSSSSAFWEVSKMNTFLSHKAGEEIKSVNNAFVRHATAGRHRNINQHAPTQFLTRRGQRVYAINGSHREIPPGNLHGNIFITQPKNGKMGQMNLTYIASATSRNENMEDSVGFRKGAFIPMHQ